MTVIVQIISDTALRVQLGRRTDSDTQRRVRSFCHAVSTAELYGVTGCTPGYTAATVVYEPWRVSGSDLIVRLRTLAANLVLPPASDPDVVEIPVCYGGELGPDLAEVASLHGMTEKEVIARHCEPLYAVEFIGFLPGFPYLSGLPDLLSTPRLQSPRLNVAAGSVGIGGSQTGFYPLDSPGGWHIIGRTPLKLFDIHREPCSLLKAGDTVRILPIELTEFSRRSGAQ